MSAASARRLAVIGSAIGLAAVAAIAWRARGPAPHPEASSGFAGSAACGACHAKQLAAWQGSQHALAMRAPSGATVLGDFHDAQFTQGSVTTTFRARDGAFVVNTDGADGKLADFQVAYAFGLAPLQQYLLPQPGGRLQAFGIAWDARPREQGGQRWFHLNAAQPPAAGDPLHWTGLEQTWNHQCADCHATNLRKNYDAARRAYRTGWSEIGVGCEACHGPGARHVAWARQDPAQRGADRALTVPRAREREIETCAQCHSRREQFSDDKTVQFLDAYRPELLAPGLYEADGQMREEAYNYGSFLQSRMAARGVTCADCHEPHAGTLRASGNAVCAQCHAPAQFDAASHHRHREGSAGARCAACHMPSHTYMQVDVRHDHSFRIPRPDRSATLGTPNACSACHADRKPQWAAAAIRRWYPKPKPGLQGFAEAFHAADTGAVGATRALLAVIADADEPPIVRASALARLGPRIDDEALVQVEGAAHDASPLVRAAAARVFAAALPEARARALAPLLRDPVRLVRMDAARALLGDAESLLAPDDAAALARALDEHLAAQRFNADRPGAQVEIADVLATRGDAAGARAALEEALYLEPGFAPAAVNLADLLRAAGDEAAAERVLREALARNAEQASLHHALGLSLVRQHRTDDALAELARAARLDPSDPRHAFVWGIALHDSGRADEALRVLEAAHERHAADRDILGALVSYEAQAGATERARRYDALLQALP